MLTYYIRNAINAANDVQQYYYTKQFNVYSIRNCPLEYLQKPFADHFILLFM